MYFCGQPCAQEALKPSISYSTGQQVWFFPNQIYKAYVGKHVDRSGEWSAVSCEVNWSEEKGVSGEWKWSAGTVLNAAQCLVKWVGL
eukprot:1144111-Pelagomonas_calceolata.AAC.4